MSKFWNRQNDDSETETENEASDFDEEVERHGNSTDLIIEESDDMISQLPDCLLVHILSFLSLNEAVRTCLLSKRWQFIWTGILTVDFSKFRSKDKKIQSWDWFGKMLAMCNSLKKLCVGLTYGDFLSSDLDNWIHLAIKNKVKAITLDLIYPPSGKSDEEIYRLPEELYSYSSLTKLSLCNCVLAPQGIVNWGSLEKLRVEKVDLSDSLMEKILSGCGVLEFLRLKACTGLNNLNIYSPNLTTLQIRGYKDQIPNISAPHLSILLIDNWGQNYKINYEEDDDNEEDDENEEDDNLEDDINEENNHEVDNEESDEESDEEIEELPEELYSYELPEEVYSYSSLTKLTLRKCVLTPQGIITWGSLKSLRVDEAKLSDSLMEKILSGCPVLEFLHLKLCENLSNLNIYSPNLTTLEILGYNNQIPNISAPHLRILLIQNQGYEEQRFMLKDLSSIVEVKLESWFKLSTSSDNTLMNHMKQILQSLKSAKTIDLSEEYLPVISLLEVEGWKFPSFIQLRCLKLEALTHEMSTIPGILALLRSSPGLEALEIDMHKQYISSGEDGVSLHNYDTDSVASHLKTVKINLFDGPDFFNETLVSILLKSAQVLEEMTIKVESNQDESNKIVERLLTFPRASSKAVIVPCS